MFDLDPGEPAGTEAVLPGGVVAERAVRGIGLQMIVKTSGAKGLQVYVPLNTPITYEQTKPFARAVAD